MPLSIQVTSIFHITGHGTVLAGEVHEGTVRVGQRVVVRAPAEFLEDRIQGIEVDRENVTKAGKGTSVGLLFANLTPQLLPSGIVAVGEGGFDVVELLIEEKEQPWWHFW